MSYAGGVTDVDDFSGRRIHYEGIKYGPVQQQVFWDAVHRYLMKKVHEAFAEWQVATLNYPNQMRLWSLSELERDLRDFQVKIRELSMDTDQRLRGRRAPDGVSEVVAPRGSVSSEIARLAKAQRTLLIGSKDDTVRPTRTAIVRHIDSFYDNHKGLVWFAGLILAAIT